MKKVKWGIVGCGVISDSHAKGIAAAAEAELCAVCDIIPERAEKLSKEYGGLQVYTSFEEMFEKSGIDAVSVCTPSGIHGMVCRAAAEAGIHILCEKPLEITTEEMDKTIQSVIDNNVLMESVFQKRYTPAYRKVKEAIDSGMFGKLVLADTYMKLYRSQEYYDSGDWRGTWELDGGGALMNQCIHGIDLLLWYAGEVESVFARCRTQLRNIEVEDTAIASIAFKNGAVGVIEGTTSVYPNREPRIELHFEKGTIVVADKGILEWTKEGEKLEIPDAHGFSFTGPNPGDLPASSHTPQIEGLARAILSGGKAPNGPEEGRRAVDLILAIYKSSKEKREIFL